MPTVDDVLIDTRLPAYARLRDRLASRIASGEWGPEEALPSENRLAADYDLSVGTVRKAIEQLVGEGLLERRRGSGTYLRKPAFDATLFRFFQLRGEPGERATIPESRLLVREVVAAPAELATLLGDDRLIRIERLRSLATTPLLAEAIFLPESRFPGFARLPESRIGPLLYPFYFEEYGIFIAAATDELTFATADDATAHHLHLAPGDPVAVIERTARDIERRPVEWRRARGDARNFRYRVELG